MYSTREEARKALYLSLSIFTAGMVFFFIGSVIVVFTNFWGGEIGGLFLILWSFWFMHIAFKKDVDEDEIIRSPGPPDAQPASIEQARPGAGRPESRPPRRSYLAQPLPRTPAEGDRPWRYPEPSSARWENQRGTSLRFIIQDLKALGQENNFQLGILIMASILLLINAIILTGMMDFDTMTFRDGLGGFFPYMMLMDALFPIVCFIYCGWGYIKLHKFERMYG